MKKRFPILFVLSSLLLVLCGIPNSQFDETSPSFIPPKIIVDTATSSIKMNDTVHFDTATIILEGNFPQCRFQIQIDNLGWTMWKPAGAFPVNSLSERKHTLRINTMYEGGIKIFSDSLLFFVEIQGYRPQFAVMGDTTIAVDTGTLLSLSASATGNPAISYQWYKGISALEGKNDTILTFTSVKFADTGTFFCIASNNYGTDTCRVFKIKIRIIKGGIKGIVISSKTVEKIPGVIVRLKPGDVKDTINSDGIFEFTHLRSGTYAIVISQTGYLDYSKAGIEILDTGVRDLGIVALAVMDSTAGNLRVIYDGNGSSSGSAPIDTKYYKQTMTITVLGNSGNLTKSSFVFCCWCTKANGSGKTYAAGDTFSIGTTNDTLFAKWKILPTLTLTYDGNGKTDGNTPSDTNKYFSDDSVIVLGNSGNLGKTGFSFTGWNTKPDGSGTDYNAGSKFPMSSISAILYAKWSTKPTYRVVYHKNNADSGNVPAEASFEAGVAVTVSGNTGKLLKIGYMFSGWNTKANGSGTSYAPAATFTQDTINDTLFAKWTVNQYTVKFNSQGGGAVASETKNYGDTVVTPTTPSYTGYTFIDWYAEAACQTKWVFATFKVTQDTTLYAKWTIIQDTVTFNSNGGSAVSPIPVNYGSTFAKPTDPNWTGRTFVAWYKDAALSALWNFVSDIVNSNIILYAKWSLNSYAVSFNSEGGSTVNAEQRNFGDTVITPATPSFLGKTFSGWYKEATYITKWDFKNFKVTQDTTLYARWVITQDTVTFNNEGGSPVSPVTVNFGLTIAKPANPTRVGYTFIAWYKESSYATQWNFASDVVTDNITLYAKWTINQYTINFDLQGPASHLTPSSIPSATINYNSLATKPYPDPQKTSYVFDKWCKIVGIDTIAWNFSSDVVTDNITLYAKWLIKDIDGNVYTEVNINGQVWMVQNLKTTQYNDGTAIPLVTDNTAWSNLDPYSEAYCWYGNNSVNKNPYGALYSAGILYNNELIAPLGWHVPTHDEWSTLIASLGGASTAGGKLKEAGTVHWNSPNTGAVNSTGFTALPGGIRNYDDGAFSDMGNVGNWWTNYNMSIFAWNSAQMTNTNATCDNTSGYVMKSGLSIRCVRDW
jgi:uncharacterized protein (TIGR02145 family)/uncharacterized repeat protein (TIGR02543 family)